MVVHSQAGIRGGLWYATEPFIRLSENASDEQLADALGRALLASVNHQDPPPGLDLKDVERPIYRLFGVRSRREFMEGARTVHIEERDDDLVEIVPKLNKGARDGFAWAEDRSITLRSPSLSDLAESVRRGLAAAE